jgi:hypothetical protein
MRKDKFRLKPLEKAGLMRQQKIASDMGLADSVSAKTFQENSSICFGARRKPSTLKLRSGGFLPRASGRPGVWLTAHFLG